MVRNFREKISRIIQIGDIHIRKFDRHEEYEEQFKKLASKIEENISDVPRSEVRIVVCGDIAHQKNNISPEENILIAKFFKMLGDIAGTYVIAGNHDYLVNNIDKLDCLTQIFHIGNFENVIYADSMLGYESGIIEDGNNLAFALFSSFDSFARPENLTEYVISNPDTKIIGLFHGSIVGAKLDNGSMMDNGVDTSIFEGCNVVLAGHIHKRQEIKRMDTRIVYSGSLIQQDMGEKVSGHGFNVWNIDTMEYTPVDIENDYAMYKINIKNPDDIKKGKEFFSNL